MCKRAVDPTSRMIVANDVYRKSFAKEQQRPGISGHELNPGSFARDWIRANSKVRSRL